MIFCLQKSSSLPHLGIVSMDITALATSERNISMLLIKIPKLPRLYNYP
jgi:hypothetical protein